MSTKFDFRKKSNKTPPRKVAARKSAKKSRSIAEEFDDIESVPPLANSDELEASPSRRRRLAGAPAAANAKKKRKQAQSSPDTVPGDDHGDAGAEDELDGDHGYAAEDTRARSPPAAARARKDGRGRPGRTAPVSPQARRQKAKRSATSVSNSSSVGGSKSKSSKSASSSSGPASTVPHLAVGSASEPVQRAVARLGAGLKKSVVAVAASEQSADQSLQKLLTGPCLDRFAAAAARILTDAELDRSKQATRFARATKDTNRKMYHHLRVLKEILATEKAEWDSFTDELYSNSRLVRLATFRCELDSLEDCEQNLSLETVELLNEFKQELDKKPISAEVLKSLSMKFDELIPTLTASAQDASLLRDRVDAKYQQFVNSYALQSADRKAPQKLIRKFINHA